MFISFNNNTNGTETTYPSGADTTYPSGADTTYPSGAHEFTLGFYLNSVWYIFGVGLIPPFFFFWTYYTRFWILSLTFRFFSFTIILLSVIRFTIVKMFLLKCRIRLKGF